MAKAVETDDIGTIVAVAVKAALETAQANGPIRKISVGERQKRGLGGTPFNPTGKKRTLKYDFYQDGALMRERYLHDNEIEMLHQITPGSYLNKLITVTEKVHGDGRKEIFIDRKPGKDVAMTLKGLAPNFHAQLVKMVAEAKEQKAAKRAAMRAELADTE